MADGGLSGLANLRKQLQTDDPSSPGNALSQLVQWWSDWRAQQAAEPDVLNPPMSLGAPGTGLQGLVSAALKRPGLEEALKAFTQLSHEAGKYGVGFVPQELAAQVTRAERGLRQAERDLTGGPLARAPRERRRVSDADRSYGPQGPRPEREPD